MSAQGSTVFIETSDGMMDGWLAVPESPVRGAVILCPEIFGVTVKTRRAAADIAEKGYAVLAVNLFYRAAPRVELADDDAGRARGLDLLQGLERGPVLADLEAAIADLKARRLSPSGVAVIGFSSGGHIAYLAAAKLDIRLAVSFYGGWITTTDIPLSRPEPTIQLTPEMGRRGVRLLYFVGDRDFLITSAHCAQIERALTENGVRHEVTVYPGASHAFLFEGGELYDPAASSDAWKRTFTALAEELKGVAGEGSAP